MYDDYSIDGDDDDDDDDDDDGDVMKQWITLFRTAQPQISLGLAFFLRSWVDLGKWLYAHTVAQSHICRAMHRRHPMSRAVRLPFYTPDGTGSCLENAVGTCV